MTALIWYGMAFATSIIGFILCKDDPENDDMTLFYVVAMVLSFIMFVGEI